MPLVVKQHLSRQELNTSTKSGATRIKHFDEWTQHKGLTNFFQFSHPSLLQWLPTVRVPSTLCDVGRHAGNADECILWPPLSKCQELPSMTFDPSLPNISQGHVYCSHLIFFKGLRFQCRNVDFLVALPLLTERPIRELALLIGHQMASLSECKVIDIQQLLWCKCLMRNRLWLTQVYIYQR